MPLRQSDLIQKSAVYREVINEGLLKTASLGKTKSAFLCHSHKDEKLVKGLIALFQEKKIDLYIDWKDHSMPETPDAETAEKMQMAIWARDLFFFLATANSKASRWCPWEIGYADSSRRKIFIIPTTNDYETYGNEYLQLYAKIDERAYQTRSGLVIFNAGTTIGEWLSTDALR